MKRRPKLPSPIWLCTPKAILIEYSKLCPPCLLLKDATEFMALQTFRLSMGFMPTTLVSGLPAAYVSQVLFND